MNSPTSKTIRMFVGLGLLTCLVPFCSPCTLTANAGETEASQAVSQVSTESFGNRTDGMVDVYRDTFSDTWVATDALGRALPTSDEVGPPRADKTVGIFYFLWLGRHGERGPFDISKILTADPTAMENPASELWGPMHVPHHWGESLFGYYVSDDDSVLQKARPNALRCGGRHGGIRRDEPVDISRKLAGPLPGVGRVASCGESSAPDCVPLPFRRSAKGGPGTVGPTLRSFVIRGAVVSLGGKATDSGRPSADSLRYHV